jgi:hypothetical protein
VEADAGELGKQCLQELAEVLADQLPILLLEQRLAGRW